MSEFNATGFHNFATKPLTKSGISADLNMLQVAQKSRGANFKEACVTGGRSRKGRARFMMAGPRQPPMGDPHGKHREGSHRRAMNRKDQSPDSYHTPQAHYRRPLWRNNMETEFAPLPTFDLRQLLHRQWPPRSSPQTLRRRQWTSCARHSSSCRICLNSRSTLGSQRSFSS